MKLWAVSDIHLGYPENVELLSRLEPHPDDWLILAGDVGETPEQLALAIDLLRPRHKGLIWTPGNHDLWTLPGGASKTVGEARYRELVAICQNRGVLTPEDPFQVWDGEGGPIVIVPMFLLYDYSFRPATIPADQALAWAEESGVVCADEAYLRPDPHPSREAWCALRLEETVARIEREVPSGLQTVLVNHFPFREDLIYLPRIPRFSIWCGTKKTEDWHRRFRARVAVSGHLHIPRTQWRDGVRFEEVSLGYPRQWSGHRTAANLLREILPGPPSPPP